MGLFWNNMRSKFQIHTLDMDIFSRLLMSVHITRVWVCLPTGAETLVCAQK